MWDKFPLDQTPWNLYCIEQIRIGNSSTSTKNFIYLMWMLCHRLYSSHFTVVNSARDLLSYLDCLLLIQQLHVFRLCNQKFFLSEMKILSNSSNGEKENMITTRDIEHQSFLSVNKSWISWAVEIRKWLCTVHHGDKWQGEDVRTD